eukprot:119212-Hanusia_phi.AAC.1
MAARRLVTDHSVSHERHADAVTQGRTPSVTLQRHHPGPGPGRECGSPRAAPVQGHSEGRAGRISDSGRGAAGAAADRTLVSTVSDHSELGSSRRARRVYALKRSTQQASRTPKYPQAYWAADLSQPCGRAASVWVGRAAGLGNLVLRDP